jgi:hypothetical protein
MSLHGCPPAFLLPQSGGFSVNPEVSRAGSPKTVPKKFQNFRELRSNVPITTIQVFGPFRLDAEAEILFHGDEPLPQGKRAVALLRVLLKRPSEQMS